VVHERSEAIAAPETRDRPAARHGAHRLEPSEVILIEEFLRRRADLDPWVRLQSARRIATRMQAKLDLAVVEDEERLLEDLAAEYRAGDRYR
jgi:hypothetical protein